MANSSKQNSLEGSMTKKTKFWEFHLGLSKKWIPTISFSSKTEKDDDTLKGAVELVKAVIDDKNHQHESPNISFTITNNYTINIEPPGSVLHHPQLEHSHLALLGSSQDHDGSGVD